MKQQQAITTLPPSPEAERRSRMIKYTIAMSIRVLCIFALLFAKGWWLAVFAAGAILLPYFAVVLANVSGPTRQPRVLRPGGLVRSTPPQMPQPTESPIDDTKFPLPDDGATNPSDAGGPTPTPTSDSRDDERGAA
ncbi:DUF3099 domain-containing protein [Agromyces badenianii]|uniref:DUF3099 domain-containing protein n=1 Tax=Agromyces badenianii TaxID=2080742 RepID=A0A2S0WW27_9MICO|nr:DUF3099 domain-containing protein [Agromyces badenianii]AWB95545.1 DUF3099 domain-containing protein [Agromyces badenianii]